MNPIDPQKACADVLDDLEAFLDGDLEPAEAARIQEHLEGCPTCAAELALAERIQRELRSLPLLDCPPEVLERVQQAGGKVLPFAPPAGPAPSARRSSLRPRLIAAAALVVLTLGGGLVFLRFQEQGQQPSAAEIARAEREARFALAYFGKVSRRASLDLREEVIEKRLLAPVTRNVARSLTLAEPAREGRP
jgi:anti-sigma factor (TIGR02949 family)